MSQPRVTISIPTYKGAAFIEETIASVLSQSLQDFEILVFDDASPDATQDVVEAIGDPRISYHRNAQNLGPEGNWNLGLKQAKSAYYKLLPHDDILKPEALARQVDILERDHARSIALVFGAREVIGPNGQNIMARAPFGRAPKRMSPNNLINACVRKGTNIIGEPGNGLIRTDLIQKIGLYDARHPYTVDLDFWFRALKHGDAFYTGEIDSAFRMHPGSWSNALGKAQANDFAGTVRQYSNETDFHISTFSRMIGAARTPLNAVLRQVFYKTYLR